MYFKSIKKIPSLYTHTIAYYASKAAHTSSWATPGDYISLYFAVSGV